MRKRKGQELTKVLPVFLVPSQETKRNEEGFEIWHTFCCEYAALRLLFAGSYSYSAGQVPEMIRGLSGGLTQGRKVSLLCQNSEAGPLFPR